MLETGQRLPMEVLFNTRVRCTELDSRGHPNPYKWEPVISGDLFKDKRVILFSLPGAYTPTCSAYQLPGFEENYAFFKSKGVEEIYCLSVNDTFVMNAWFRHQNIKNVKPIPDGSGKFTKELGMLVDKDNLGFGMRSWRYALLVNDGVIEKAFVEAGMSDNAADDPYEVSDPATMASFIMNESEVGGKQLELNLEESLGTQDKIGG